MTTDAVPDGYTMRALTLDEVDAACGLFNERAQCAVGDDEYGTDEFRLLVTLPTRSLEHDTRLVVDAAGDAAAYADVHFNNPYVLAYLRGCVAQGHVGRGIGSDLIAWGEARARARLAEAPEDSMVILRSIIPSFDEAGIALLQEHGFEIVRYMLKMAMRFERPVEAPVWPTGITLRTVRPDEDLRPIYNVHVEIFRDHWGFTEHDPDEGFAEFRHWIGSISDFDYAYFWLAEDGDQIAGMLLCWPSFAGDKETAYLGVLGVRRPWRQRGIGRGLMLHALRTFQECGKRGACLHCDATNITGATRIYRSVGMHEARRYITLDKVLRPGRSPFLTDQGG